MLELEIKSVDYRDTPSYNFNKNNFSIINNFRKSAKLRPLLSWGEGLPWAAGQDWVWLHRAENVLGLWSLSATFVVKCPNWLYIKSISLWINCFTYIWFVYIFFIKHVCFTKVLYMFRGFFYMLICLITGWSFIICFKHLKRTF